VILETIGSLVVGAIGAGIGWGLTEFAARPIRRFFDLRGEIIRRIAQYNNVPVRFRETPDGKREVLPFRETRDGEREVLPFSDDEDARLKEAHSVLRDLAAQMRGFAHNETWATWVLSVRYDPGRASEGLFGLSNDIAVVGGRHRAKKIVADALRIPENIL
jgi:hypothetical protein